MKVKSAVPKKLNRAPVPPAPKARKSMHIQEADNGGFISSTDTHTPGGDYEPSSKNVHTSVTALNAHIRKTFPPKPASKTAAKTQPAWAGVANKMLQ